MPNDRLETLRQMVAQNPQDTFCRYGLAMEYLNSGDVDEAVRQYRAVLEINPDYGAAYYQGGRALERAGDIEGARELYQRGLEVTARTGDRHTHDELQAALDLL